MSGHILLTNEEYDLIPREKVWRVLQEYGVDRRLLLAVKSFYSCSDVCDHVDGVKLQPFIHCWCWTS